MNNAVKLIAATIVALSATSAMADSGKWYMGVGMGLSRYHDWATKPDITDFMNAYGATQGVDHYDGSPYAKVDDTSTGYKLFGGYTLTDSIAVELSYIDMGKVDAYSDVSGTFYDVANNAVVGDLYAKAQAEVSAFILDLNLNVPLVSGATLLMQAGAYHSDTKLTLHGGGSIVAEPYYYSHSENSTGVHFGVGLNFAIAQSINVRAEWESLQDIKANHGKSDVSMLSAALVYGF